MKWSKEQEQQIKELGFERKSNAEIAEAMNIPLKDVHQGRSRFGITVAKVEEALKNGISARTTKIIRDEIAKVENARDEALRKIERCDARMEELLKELKEAK